MARKSEVGTLLSGKTGTGAGETVLYWRRDHH